jgi:hypothetical protein
MIITLFQKLKTILVIFVFITSSSSYGNILGDLDNLKEKYKNEYRTYLNSKYGAFLEAYFFSRKNDIVGLQQFYQQSFLKYKNLIEVHHKSYLKLNDKLSSGEIEEIPMHYMQLGHHQLSMRNAIQEIRSIVYDYDKITNIVENICSLKNNQTTMTIYKPSAMYGIPQIDYDINEGIKEVKMDFNLNFGLDLLVGDNPYSYGVSLKPNDVQSGEIGTELLGGAPVITTASVAYYEYLTVNSMYYSTFASAPVSAFAVGAGIGVGLAIALTSYLMSAHAKRKQIRLKEQVSKKYQQMNSQFFTIAREVDQNSEVLFNSHCQSAFRVEGANSIQRYMVNNNQSFKHSLLKLEDILSFSRKIYENIEQNYYEFLDTQDYKKDSKIVDQMINLAFDRNVNNYVLQTRKLDDSLLDDLLTRITPLLEKLGPSSLQVDKTNIYQKLWSEILSMDNSLYENELWGIYKKNIIGIIKSGLHDD